VSERDLSFTKYCDKANPPITAACTKGTHIDRAVITVRKAGGDNQLEYSVPICIIPDWERPRPHESYFDRVLVSLVRRPLRGKVMSQLT
jgi:hypothetical protein